MLPNESEPKSKPGNGQGDLDESADFERTSAPARSTASKTSGMKLSEMPRRVKRTMVEIEIAPGSELETGDLKSKPLTGFRCDSVSEDGHVLRGMLRLQRLDELAGRDDVLSVRRPYADETIVLLHGLGRTSFSMLRPETYFNIEGYRVINLNYPSAKLTVEEIAQDCLNPLVEEALNAGARRVHFYAHSLGGIVVRQLLESKTLPEGSRMVMLCPPNNGSEVADNRRDTLAYKWFTGPAGQQLGTDEESILRRLSPTPSIEVGVITGNVSLDLWFNRYFDGEHDGKVSVESARLPGMRDFLVVPRGHTFIMNSAEVLRAAAFFLREGRFSSGADE